MSATDASDESAAELTADDVRHVGKLARIALADDEIEAYRPQMASILGYVSRLQEVDLAGVQPLANPLEATNILRVDEVTPGLSREAALESAPKTDGTYFLVPEILETES